MANTRQPATSRRTRTTSARRTDSVYIEGNTARRLREVPEHRYARTQKQAVTKQVPKSRSLSREAQENRARAMSMSPGIICFICVMCVIITASSVKYVRLKSERTNAMNTVKSLEANLAELREDNDAYENLIKSDIDLTRIKKIAIGRLGMKYPSDEQKITYSRESGSYVRQYQDIPGSK